MPRPPSATRPRPRVSRMHGRPLYVQLYELLREQIRSGDLTPGDLIPAESALMRTHAVSRITVRSALDQLARDGFIVRQRGRGTFVRAIAPETAACFISFTEQVRRQGRRPSARVLDVRVAPARSYRTARGEGLPFAEDLEVACVQRVRLVDGLPVSLVTSYIPHALVPGIGVDTFHPEGPEQSLLYVLERRYGVVLDKGEETLEPAHIDALGAEALCIDEGAPVARKTCVVRDQSNAVVLYEEAAWSGPQTHVVKRVPTPP